MLMLSFAGLDPAHWQEWIIPVVGALSTGLALVMGYALLRRSPLPKLPSPARQPDYDPFVQGSLREQRKSFRRAGNAIEVLISDAEVSQQPQHGLVLDRSLGGLRLLASESLTVGATITVRTLNAPPSVPWVEMEVRSCRQVSDGWELGCKFVKTPPWGVLLLFG
jgi:hypothetical protein